MIHIFYKLLIFCIYLFYLVFFFSGGLGDGNLPVIIRLIFFKSLNHFSTYEYHKTYVGISEDMKYRTTVLLDLRRSEQKLYLVKSDVS